MDPQTTCSRAKRFWSFNAQSLDHALQLVRRAEDIVGDNELLSVAEGLIYWQHVNVGIVPVSQDDEDPRKAEGCAAKVFALNPESSKGHGLRGAIRHNRADPNGAARDYKKALALDPNDPEALLWLGYHYAVSGRPDLARALMDRLQQVDPLTSINLTMYGMVAMFDGNYPEALTWTQRSVGIDPGQSHPTYDARADAGGERASQRGRGDARCGGRRHIRHGMGEVGAGHGLRAPW